MTWRCTQCHRTRTDVPVFGICPCGGHGFSQVDQTKWLGDVPLRGLRVHEPPKDMEDKD